MVITKPFRDLTKKDTRLAGGKGASLGEMTRAGIPVPPGFVVTSEAFEAFLAEADLVQEIEAALDRVKHKEMETVEEASESITALILKAKVPQAIQREVLAHNAKLKAALVAVRSSATVEDGTNASWAGELESYLDTPKAQVITNLKRCWASLFSPRAIFYRFEKKFHKQHVAVAVVIQAMVQSEVSGVAFSVHPVTQDRNQLIIEAGWGLGEAIVQGAITPDSYVLDKRDVSLIDVNVATQERAIVKKGASGGTAWKPVPRAKQKKQKLSAKQITELTKLVLRIEAHYKFPVDVEWALAGGRFAITQSRPITTLR